MKIAMIGSESNPYVKTGGLADVVYALSLEMVSTGEDVAVYLPLYNQARKKLTNAKVAGEIVVHMSWREETSKILLEEKD